MRLGFFDIETTPATAMVWALFNQNISVEQVIKPTSILCFAWKWADEKEVQFYRSQKQEGPEFERMIRKAHALMSEADALCHFNGKSFDVPRLNAEFIRLGLRPPPPVAQIDLKVAVMKNFAMTSSKLAFVGPYLKIGEKVKHEGWGLWEGCLKGDKDCWARMEKYNRQDVILLEKLYHRVLPWIDQHPNMGLYIDSKNPLCRNCGSEKLQKRGERVTSVSVFDRYHCQACGRWGSARKSKKQAFPPQAV